MPQDHVADSGAFVVPSLKDMQDHRDANQPYGQRRHQQIGWQRGGRAGWMHSCVSSKSPSVKFTFDKISFSTEKLQHCPFFFFYILWHAASFQITSRLGRLGTNSQVSDRRQHCVQIRSNLIHSYVGTHIGRPGLTTNCTEPLKYTQALITNVKAAFLLFASESLRQKMKQF